MPNRPSSCPPVRARLRRRRCRCFRYSRHRPQRTRHGWAYVNMSLPGMPWRGAVSRCTSGTVMSSRSHSHRGAPAILSRHGALGPSSCFLLPSAPAGDGWVDVYLPEQGIEFASVLQFLFNQMPEHVLDVEPERLSVSRSFNPADEVLWLKIIDELQDVRVSPV